MAQPPIPLQGDPQTGIRAVSTMSTRRKTAIWLGTVTVAAAGTFAATSSTASPSIHIGDHVEIQVQR